MESFAQHTVAAALRAARMNRVIGELEKARRDPRMQLDGMAAVIEITSASFSMEFSGTSSDQQLQD